MYNSRFRSRLYAHGRATVCVYTCRYWWVKNSWGPAWGMDGFFKVTRGIDDCSIEASVGPCAVCTLPGSFTLPVTLYRIRPSDFLIVGMRAVICAPHRRTFDLQVLSVAVAGGAMYGMTGAHLDTSSLMKWPFLDVWYGVVWYDHRVCFACTHTAVLFLLYCSKSIASLSSFFCVAARAPLINSWLRDALCVVVWLAVSR